MVTPYRQLAGIADSSGRSFLRAGRAPAPSASISSLFEPFEVTLVWPRRCIKQLEALEAGSGFYLPSGAEIAGHISRVEAAGVAGRAKIWLTFDELHTKFGDLPIVAEVVSVPGDHSVKPVPNQEGLIQGRTSTQQDARAAAAAGAAIGAVKGVKDKDKKEAAEGAALGALTAYLMESGRGHELNLPKGAKLELELERALYLVKE